VDHKARFWFDLHINFCTVERSCIGNSWRGEGAIPYHYRHTLWGEH